MSSWTTAKEFFTPMESLDPLLPHVAGVIEGLNVATFSDIKNQIETDLETKISDSELIRALEAGVKLGMFNMNREFKVCREFTTKEIKKMKHMENNLMAAKSLKKIRTPKHRNSLMDYVKNEREQRKKKLNKRRQGKSGNVNTLNFDAEFYDSLCKQCKENFKTEKPTKKKTSISSIKDIRKSRLSRFNLGSETSTDTYVTTYDPGRLSGNSEDEESPKKSNLLIQKNSMETKPPYCDIFT